MTTPHIDIAGIQNALKNLQINGWLFMDFHDRDPIAKRVLGLKFKAMSTRRWFYFIPAEGLPWKIVHAIEPGRLDELPGEASKYASFATLKLSLKQKLGGSKRIAMQYSPFGNLPTVSTVDAGTVELVKSLGFEVCSSGDLIQMFEARVDQAAMESHSRASKEVQTILAASTNMIRGRLQDGKRVTERDVQAFLLEGFDASGLTCDGLNPLVAANEHAADPHFEVPEDSSAVLGEGNRLLIDLWAREKTPGAIYYDITWCYQIGGRPSDEYQRLFSIAQQARQAAKDLVIARLGAKKPLPGWEVDDAARSVISQHGLGEYFTHRTGHSIHETVHGNGVNMDNFETHDDRRIVPGCCFSIEPGIYKSPIGVRTEINIIVDLQGVVHSFGKEQAEIVVI